jgi:hypothetical protein
LQGWVLLLFVCREPRGFCHCKNLVVLHVVHNRPLMLEIGWIQSFATK